MDYDELTTSDESNSVKTILAAGHQLAQPLEIEGVPALIVPPGATVETFGHLLANPNHLQATITAASVPGFLAYWNRFAGSHSTIFVSDESGLFTGILDYHYAPVSPEWCNHIVTYKCPRSQEWKDWTAKSGQGMNQEEFARFIEDHIPEIVEPAGAELLEIATTLQAKKHVDFKSGVRLDNGAVQFTYNEEIDGKAGVTGQLKIPERIKLGIQPFHNGERYELTARFRYRITQGKLIMWFDLIRPHRILEDAVAGVEKQITDGITAGHVIQGTWNQP